MNLDQNAACNLILSKCYDQKQQKLSMWASFIDKKLVADNWIQLFKFRNWQKLTQLIICLANINDSNVEVISKLKWPNLRKLIFFFCPITQKSIKCLNKENFPILQEFKFCDNSINDKGLELLLKQFSQLKHLNIGNNGISSRGLNSMLRANLSNLLSLELYNDNIGSHGIKMLIKANCHHLLQFCTHHCKMGSQGFSHLTKAGWRHLRKCSVSNNFITTNGYETFTHFMMIKQIRQFCLGDWESINFDESKYCLQPIELLFLLSRTCQIDCSFYELALHNLHLNFTLLDMAQQKFEW